MAGAGDERLVWYASYGSNLCLARLMCYIQGGRLPGMLDSLPDYPGCQDPTPPRESRRYEISHPLYFARESKTWRGGVGFVDYTARAAAGQCTVSRIHLVTFEQFNGIVVQENSGNQASALPASTLSTLLQQGPGAHAQITPGWYGTIIYLGDLEDGHPVLSFSCSPDDLRRHVNPPSDAYMTVIMKGLAECGEERDGAVDYLTTRAAPPRGEDGMRRRLVAIASESHPAEEG